MKKIDVFPVAISTHAQESGFFGQGLLVAYAAVWKAGWLNEYFNFHQVEMFVQEDLPRIQREMVDKDNPAIYMFTSFQWTHDINIEAAKMMRQLSPGSLIMVGGPMVPELLRPGQQFMVDHDCFDVAAIGEGEETFVEALEAIVVRALSQEKPIRFTDFSDVKGLLWRQFDLNIIQNAKRPQIKDVNTIPSPYLSGVFKEPFAQNLVAYVETNRGCPFGCTYCDWGSATQSKFRLFDIDRISAELEWISSKKFMHYYPTDSNFGAFQRDLDIAKHAVSLKKLTGYPTSFATNYAKNVADRVVDIAVELFDGGLLERFSIPFQTIDQDVLKNIDRSNIKISAFDQMITRLREKWIPITTEVLVGLPGQTYETFKRDLQYFFDRVINPTVYQVVVLPNAPMAHPDYMKKYEIKINDRAEVIATSSFNEQDLGRIYRLRLAAMFLIHEKFLIYYLIYCQLEHGIKSMDIIDEMLRVADIQGDLYPVLSWVFNNMMNHNADKGAIVVEWGQDAKYIFDNIRDFYLEINDLVEKNFNLNIGKKELNSLISLQIVTVDRVNKTLPITQEVDRDVVGYFDQLKNIPVIVRENLDSTFKPLRNFSPGMIVVPDQRKKRHYSFVKVKFEQPEWPFMVEGISI